MPKQNLENEKWINIKFFLMNTAVGLVELKDTFKKYAEELEWEVETDKKGIVFKDGNIYYSVTISPDNKKISPNEIKEKYDKIVGFAYNIYHNVVYKNEDSSEKVLFDIFESESKIWMYRIRYAEVLIIEAPLKKVIELDKENYNLSKSAFIEQSISDFYKDEIKKMEKRFISIKEREETNRIIKILEDNGIIKITPKIKKWKLNF